MSERGTPRFEIIEGGKQNPKQWQPTFFIERTWLRLISSGRFPKPWPMLLRNSRANLRVVPTVFENNSDDDGPKIA